MIKTVVVCEVPHRVRIRYRPSLRNSTIYRPVKGKQTQKDLKKKKKGGGGRREPVGMYQTEEIRITEEKETEYIKL